MGGYVAGPVVLAAWWRRLALIVVMEPNAMPGITNRQMGRFVSRALAQLPGDCAVTSRKAKPRSRDCRCGAEFFRIPPKPRGGPLTILITGGSRGSRTLNESTRDAWSYFRRTRRASACCIRRAPTPMSHRQSSSPPVRTPRRSHAVYRRHARPPSRGGPVVCRSGAGAVAELAAAGKPAILVPFPFAADQHQLKNAEAFVRAGAASLILDRDMNGRVLFDEIAELSSEPGRLEEWATRPAASLIRMPRNAPPNLEQLSSWQRLRPQLAIERGGPRQNRLTGFRASSTRC